MFKDKIHGRFVIIGGFFSLFLYVQYRHILSESHDVRFYSLQGTVTGLGFDCRTGRVTTFEGEKDGIYRMVSKKEMPETKTKKLHSPLSRWPAWKEAKTSFQAGLETPEINVLLPGGQPHQLDLESTEDHLDPHTILEAKHTTKTWTTNADVPRRISKSLHSKSLQSKSLLAGILIGSVG